VYAAAQPDLPVVDGGYLLAGRPVDEAAVNSVAVELVLVSSAPLLLLLVGQVLHSVVLERLLRRHCSVEQRPPLQLVRLAALVAAERLARPALLVDANPPSVAYLRAAKEPLEQGHFADFFGAAVAERAVVVAVVAAAVATVPQPVAGLDYLGLSGENFEFLKSFFCICL